MSLSSPSIPSIVYMFYIGFNYLGIPLLYFYMVEHLYNLGIQERGNIWFLWLMSSTCLLLMLMGFLYAKEVCNLKSQNYHTVSYENRRVGNFEVIIVLFVCVLIFIRYSHIAHVIPFVELFQGNASDVIQLRSDVQLFSGKMWRYEVFFRNVLPFVSYYLFALLLMRKTCTTFILFMFSWSLTCFVSIMNFHKGPIAYFFMGLFLVYIIKNQKKITFRNVLVTSTIILTVLISEYALFMGKNIAPKLVANPVKRLLAGQIGSAYFYLKMFPLDHDFLYGKGLPNPAGILPFEHFSTAKRVQDYIKPDLREKNRHGSSPAVYWANTYANWGVLGAFLVSFFVGVIIFAIHWYVARGKLTPLRIALIVWFALHLSSISVTSLGKFLVDTDLIAVLFCALFIKYGPVIRRGAIKSSDYRQIQEMKNSLKEDA